MVERERRIENEELSRREGLLLAFFLFLSLKENQGEGVGDNWVWPFVSSILSFFFLFRRFFLLRLSADFRVVLRVPVCFLKRLGCGICALNGNE